MGTWGEGSFENDMAGDWKDACCATIGIKFIKDTLTMVISFDGDYLDADECQRGLAAAETVAAIKNGSISALPEDLRSWVSKQVVTIEQDLTEIALRAIDRVMSDSELKDLWEEDEWPPLEWRAVIDDLRNRLKH